MIKVILRNFVFVILGLSSCKKDDYKTPPVASLTLVNTITGGKTVKLGSRAVTIANNSSAQLTFPIEGEDLYIWPIGDSAHPYYTSPKFVATDQDVYSLFLGGIETSVSGIMIKEDIPYRTDSTGGVRFINLSPNSPLLNINLLATPTVNEVSNLAYQQYSGFISYPAKVSTLPYSFQIRNSATGAILLTYAFNNSINRIPRFSNITLVIRGKVGGTGTQALGITRVAQDR